MKKRELFKTAAAFGLAALILSLALGKPSAGSGMGEAPNGADGNQSTAIQNSLTPPAHGSIPVAFLISEGAVMIDFTGPWEVFQDVNIPGRAGAAFRLYTVAATPLDDRSERLDPRVSLRFDSGYVFRRAASRIEWLH